MNPMEQWKGATKEPDNDEIRKAIDLIATSQGLEVDWELSVLERCYIVFLGDDTDHDEFDVKEFFVKLTMYCLSGEIML